MTYPSHFSEITTQQIKTHSRPQVSNDNPFSEAQFRTMKYRPEFPERFGCLEDSRRFCREFFGWYNNEHHHSALGLMVPAAVHDGRAKEMLVKRQQVLEGFYSLHPERFVKRPPRLAELPQAVWINPPAKTTHQDAPGLKISSPAVIGVEAFAGTEVSADMVGGKSLSDKNRLLVEVAQ